MLRGFVGRKCERMGGKGPNESSSETRVGDAWVQDYSQRELLHQPKIEENTESGRSGVSS
jgi:hypothetical protein